MSGTLSQFLQSPSSTNPSSRENTRMTPLFKSNITNFAKSRAKSAAKLSTAATSAKFLSSRASGTLLEEIKHRKFEGEQAITPEVAMKVVRKFLLPMFEAESRSSITKNRASALGIIDSATARVLKPLAAISGTVYGELKLSDRLMLELTDAKETVRRLEGQVRDASQKNASAEHELAVCTGKLKKVLEDAELLRHQFDSLKQSNDQGDLAKALISNQLIELKAGYIKCEEDRQHLTTELHEEKALNDKYRNKATELEHRNSLLRMENDVIGERLKGLYGAFDRIIGRMSLDQKINHEFRSAALSSAVLSEFKLEVDTRLTKIVEEIDGVKVDFDETMKLRNEMKAERDKLFARLKKEMTKYAQESKKIEEERVKTATEYGELEKRHKILSEEQDKTRQKLKQMRVKRRQFGEMEEKLCKNCGRSYNDAENYNWSCRTHFSKYGGEMWWCCGKAGQNAPGCRLSKHESKEDEDDEIDKNEDSKAQSGNLKCASCKDIGHRAQDCIRDPNPRGSAEMPMEMERIEGIKKKKKDDSASDVDIQFKSISLLADRLGEANAFAVEDSSLASNSSISDRGMAEDDEFFKDIMRIKDNISFHDSLNLHLISDIVTKEMEQENRRKSRIKSRQSVLVGSANDSKFSNSKQGTPENAFALNAKGIRDDISKHSSVSPSPKNSFVSRKSFSSASTPVNTLRAKVQKF